MLLHSPLFSPFTSLFAGASSALLRHLLRTGHDFFTAVCVLNTLCVHGSCLLSSVL